MSMIVALEPSPIPIFFDSLHQQSVQTCEHLSSEVNRIAAEVMDIANTLAATVVDRLSELWIVLKQHSDLLNQLGMFTLNTAVFAGKGIEQVPDFVGDCSRAGLSYIGVVAIPSMLGYLEKDYEDLTRAVRDGDHFAIVPMAVKVANASMDIILMVGGLVASAFLVTGQPAIATAFYAAGRPFAMVGMVATIALHLYGWASNRRLLTRIEHLEAVGDDKKIQQLFRDLSTGSRSEHENLRQVGLLLHGAVEVVTGHNWDKRAARIPLTAVFAGKSLHDRVSNFNLSTCVEQMKEACNPAKIQQLFRSFVKGSGSDDPDLRHMATLMQRVLDKDRWYPLRDRLSQEIKNETLTAEVAKDILATVKKACEDQDRGYKETAALGALGYAAMAVCRANPNSLIESATLWGMSLLWTSKMVGRKISEADTATALKPKEDQDLNKPALS